MKKMLIVLLAIVLTLGLVCTASAAGDGNIDQGGGHMGDGTGESHWDNWKEGVRITIVDSYTGNRAVGTKTFDWLRFPQKRTQSCLLSRDAFFFCLGKDLADPPNELSEPARCVF